MTDEERALRRKLAGLGTSCTRTRIALESAGDGPMARRYRAKLRAVKQKEDELRWWLTEMVAQNTPPHGTRFPVLIAADMDPQKFVAFWERLYSGYDEDFYIANIGQPLTPERILKWFEWKNGTRLSANKAKTILQYSLSEEQITAEATDAMVAEYLNRPGGAIWRIFSLHLQHPTRFPIYDQHVHRAMAFMQGRESLDIPGYNPKKVVSYLGSYIPFFRSFSSIESRRVDRALWAFGKFLSTTYGKPFVN